MADGSLIWITGLAASGKTTIAQAVYQAIKEKFPNTVYLDGDAMRGIWGIWSVQGLEGRKKMAMSYAKQCSLLTSQGIHVVMSTVSLFHEVHEYNRVHNSRYHEILLSVDEALLTSRLKENTDYDPEKSRWVASHVEFPKHPDLVLENNTTDQIEGNVSNVLELFEKELQVPKTS